MDQSEAAPTGQKNRSGLGWIGLFHGAVKLLLQEIEIQPERGALYNMRRSECPIEPCRSATAHTGPSQTDQRAGRDVS
jgi:hypothetical protein